MSGEPAPSDPFGLSATVGLITLGLMELAQDRAPDRLIRAVAALEPDDARRVTFDVLFMVGQGLRGVEPESQPEPQRGGRLRRSLAAFVEEWRR